MNVKIKRFNIYSCLTIQHNDVQICFDPAKIRKCDIESIKPDVIFISHESMDHMEPAQVYILQKKKNCKVFCSIACAIDLIQAFPYDYEFINNIDILLPGAKKKFNNIIIETQKSIHCDYMLPLVFKITFMDSKTSIIHCFDTLLSEEIIKLSENTSLAIIPVGIAKGVSVNSGLEFMEKLHSQRFVTNHLKSSKELQELERLANKNYLCTFMDWNESADIDIENVTCDEHINDFNIAEIIKESHNPSKEELMWLMSNINVLKTELINNKKLLENLFFKYKAANESEKVILINIFIYISLLDSNLVTLSLIEDIKSDLNKRVSLKNNNLHTVILLFLGIYAQQSGIVSGAAEVLKLVDDKNEHITYWVIEFLGRCIVADKLNYKNLIDDFFKVINVPSIYNSVVARRKIFWELYRIMKVIPSSTSSFVGIFEDGLTDSNPDVELLATLCFGLANKVYRLNEAQLEKIFALLKDQEDDVRETAVKTIRSLDNKEYILLNKDKAYELVNDSNCHVAYEARLTKNAISEWKS